MRRPRPTVRTLMVVVAVIATLLGIAAHGGDIYSRWRAYRIRVEAHAAAEDYNAREAFFARHGRRWEPRIHGFSLVADRRPIDPATADRAERLAAYHAQMRAKYTRAARAPWRPVEPDPPPPE